MKKQQLIIILILIQQCQTFVMTSSFSKVRIRESCNNKLLLSSSTDTDTIIANEVQLQRWLQDMKDQNVLIEDHDVITDNQNSLVLLQTSTTNGSSHHQHYYYSKHEEEEEVVVEDDRLAKARKILEELEFLDEYKDINLPDDTEQQQDDVLLSQQQQQLIKGGLLKGSRTYSFQTRFAKGSEVAQPSKKYDPEKAEKLLFKQPAKWLVRNIEIGVPLSLWTVSIVYDFITNQQNNKKRAEELTSILASLGPAIIKGGQALASRPDLLPQEYLQELQKLQDDVPRFSSEVAFATVESELNVKFEDVFELLIEEPIAAASIGQVYKARLKSNGDLVALKIQRPNCEDIIALDLYVLRWWSGVANFVIELLQRDIDFKSIIDDFGELIYREIDYVAEAANAQRFNELYAGVTDIFVPKVYTQWTTSRVLTMEWVDGARLTDFSKLDSWKLDRDKLIDILVQCSMRQILENGFFHADPHAGNLLACEDGRLCFLDFGMMSYANQSQRNGFLLAVVHLVNRDWPELVRLYQRLGFIPMDINVTPIEIALENALPDVLNADISELNFKNVINKLGDIMFTFPFSLPPFYISIIRCLGVLEGLAIQVDPQFKIISDAYPYIAGRILTDDQEEMKEALRRLALTNDGHIRWSRLEGLLEEARGSSVYDPSIAIDQLTNYLLSENGDVLLTDLSEQIVDGADRLGSETVGYIVQASSALIINDEVSLVRAFKALQAIYSNPNEENDISTILGSMFPEPTPSMKQFFKLASLLGASSTSNNGGLMKYIPVIQKLTMEPRIQRFGTEIIARLGERALSRGLRAIFGLPSPSFDKR